MLTERQQPRDSDSTTEPAGASQILRQRLRALEEQAARNSAILRNLREHELALIDTETLPELIEAFTRGTARVFSLAQVTLALADRQGKWRKAIADSDAAAAALFTPQLESLSSVYRKLLYPALGPYHPAVHRALFPSPPTPRSVALLPLRRRERLLGVLNCGSLDRGRFTAEHSSDFLDHFSRLGAVFLENAMSKEELRRSTNTDGLTGCHNRRGLQQRLLAELARALRYREPLCLMLFDLDHFKSVNDTYGHLLGDQVLVEFAARLSRALRRHDLVARYGGEEFAALLPKTRLADALGLAERIRRKVGEPMLLQSAVLSVTVSIGVCEFAPRAQKRDKDLAGLAQRLLGNADEALYRAKSGGRNRVESGTPLRTEIGAGIDAG